MSACIWGRHTVEATQFETMLLNLLYFEDFLYFIERLGAVFRVLAACIGVWQGLEKSHGTFTTYFLIIL